MSNIKLGKQSGKIAVGVMPVEAPRHQIVFEVQVRPNSKTGEQDFHGPDVFGTAQRRFLYVQWMGDLPYEKQRMFRRLKIDLNGIDKKLIEEDSALKVEVVGVGKDGGPACATASVGKWQKS